MAIGRADQNLLKRLNSALILNRLLAESPQSRAALAQVTGLNRSTISSLVSDLVAQQLIREVGFEPASSRGRPGMLLELNPAAGCVVSIEINVDYLWVVLTDFMAHPLWSHRIDVPEGTPHSRFLTLAEDLICRALEAGKAHQLKPLGIGLAVPGIVDTHRGALVYAPNLQWRSVPFRDLWGHKFGVPLYIENDGNASALGEYYFGVAKGCQDFLFLGTGIGLAGGMMLNGELYRGAGGYAGEIGHILVEGGTELCGCGQRGCWETLVGPRAVIRSIVRALDDGMPSLIPQLVGDQLDQITMQVVVTAADRGDQLARSTLASVAHHLGKGVANLINIFNPAMIVLGGSLTLAGDYLLPTISHIIATEAMPEPARMVTLALSSQGMSPCIKGAVALVIDQIVREPAISYT
ncbi:ROK family transcriptional regulator [Aggregatilinea lenta]|uniref:ROK family transcriptional regulator n=1 Tax=Aggregatilinea lenta TaxID=913108 RepID=UPI000E5BC419|nr:ROK family transcriptional regulator [Aggregatilinea lenta]